VEPLTTVLGGVEISLVSGTRVRIRQLPIRLLPRLAALMAADDEPGMVELYCQVEAPSSNIQPPEKLPSSNGKWVDVGAGWSDGLGPEEFTAIITKGEEINEDFFGQWQKRRERRQALLPKPDMEQVAKMVEAINRSNPSLLESLVQKGAGLVAPAAAAGAGLGSSSRK
jgi:hypothetical protein